MSFSATMAEMVPRFLPLLLEGFLVSCLVTIGAFALALLPGLALAALRAAPAAWLRWPATACATFADIKGRSIGTATGVTLVPELKSVPRRPATSSWTIPRTG